MIYNQNMSFNEVFEEPRCADDFWTPVPFSYKLREFLKECREQQTLFANLEGQFQKRCFTSDEKSSLFEYVFETIGGESLRNRVEAEKLAAKMMHFNGGLTKNLYCSNIWLYYYKYEDGNTHSIPLFKIFKGKETQDYFLLDTNLTMYNNFEDCVRTIQLPLSFFCLPRNGEYNFVNEKLDLEFLCSKNSGVCVAGNYIPFSQRIKSFLSVNLNKVCHDVLPVLINLLPFEVNVAGIVVSCFSILVIILKELNNSSNKKSSAIEPKTSSMMLLDIKEDSFKEAEKNTTSQEFQKSNNEIISIDRLKYLFKERSWKKLSRALCEFILVNEVPSSLLIKAFPPSFGVAITTIIYFVKLFAKFLLYITEENPQLHEEVSFWGKSEQTKNNKPPSRIIDFEGALQNLNRLSTLPSSSFLELYTKESAPSKEMSPKDGFQFVVVEAGIFYHLKNLQIQHKGLRQSPERPLNTRPKKGKKFLKEN